MALFSFCLCLDIMSRVEKSEQMAVIESLEIW